MKKMKTTFSSFRRFFIALSLVLLCAQSNIFPFLQIQPIIVHASEKSVKLNVKEKKMVKGQTFTLKVYRLKKGHTVTFHSKDEDIASVTHVKAKQCTVKALAVGNTKIIANIYKGEKKVKSLKCQIIVTPPAVSVRFKTSHCKLEVGDSINLCSYVNLKPKNTAETPVFTVSNKGRLRVSPNGFAKALSEGTVTVTATISNGKSDQMTVQIVES